MNKTEKVLIQMLKENTGTALCDSGGIPKYNEQGVYVGSDSGYGRHHEINLRRKFENEKATILSFDHFNNNVEFSVKHNLYHWLKDRLEYDSKLDKLFHNKFRKLYDTNNDKSWLELMDEFTDWLTENKGYEITGIYNNDNPFIVNSYNENSLLDQVIQFKYFTFNNEEYIILQIHGGCDVRGGYTKPHIFKSGQIDELDIFDYNRATIFCTGKDHHQSVKDNSNQLSFNFIERNYNDQHFWTTDDGYNWYEEVSCGIGYNQLENYEAKDLKDSSWEENKICFDDDKCYCPKCGSLLSAST